MLLNILNSIFQALLTTYACGQLIEQRKSNYRVRMRRPAGLKGKGNYILREIAKVYKDEGLAYVKMKVVLENVTSPDLPCVPMW